MKGTRVLVKDAEGNYLERRIWDMTEKAVFVTDNVNYDLLISGLGGVMPMAGFPIEDVYEYSTQDGDKKTLKQF